MERVRNFLLSPTGRISRKSIWQFLAFYLLICLFAFMVDYAHGFKAGERLAWYTITARMVLFWPSVVLNIKRFHDQSLSYIWALPISAVEVAWWFEALTKVGWGNSGTFVPVTEAMPFVGVLIGILSLIQFSVLFFRPGSHGPNRFGLDPREAKA